MFSFLGFIFIFVLIIIFFGLSVIGGVLRAIFGIGRRPSSSRNSTSSENMGSTHESKTENTSGNASPRKKIFDKEDGEYVDFEELKEEEKK